MMILALHPEDILAIAGVILLWVALRRLGGRRRSRPHRETEDTTRLGADD